MDQPPQHTHTLPHHIIPFVLFALFVLIVFALAFTSAAIFVFISTWCFYCIGSYPVLSTAAGVTKELTLRGGVNTVVI